MRILHIIIGLETGGAELMLERFACAHASATGAHHEVVSLTTLGKIGPRLQGRGLAVHALGLRNPLNLPMVFARLCLLIRRAKPDIVHTWMYHADLLGGLAARLVGRRHVLWNIHSSDMSAAGRRSSKKIFRLCAALSGYVPQKIACVSAAAGRAHIERGYDASRFAVIPNGIDLDKMKAGPQARARLRKALGIPAHAPVAGGVARFNETKDIETFVKACGLVAAQMPDAHFMLIGHGQDAANGQLAEWIADTDRPSAFHLLGERADIPDCLAAMDVFCSASLTESFGLSIAEAKAMEKPCVVTDVDDVPSLLGNDGLVVPPRDPDAMAEAIVTLFTTKPAYLAVLGRNARTRIEEYFSLARAVERTEALYQAMREA